MKIFQCNCTCYKENPIKLYQSIVEINNIDVLWQDEYQNHPVKINVNLEISVIMNGVKIRNCDILYINSILFESSSLCVPTVLTEIDENFIIPFDGKCDTMQQHLIHNVSLQPGLYSVLYLRKILCGQDAGDFIYRVIANSQNFVIEVEDAELSKVKFTNSKTQQITKRCSRSKCSSESLTKKQIDSTSNINPEKIQFDTIMRMGGEQDLQEDNKDLKITSFTNSQISELNIMDNLQQNNINDQDYEITEKYPDIHEIQMPVFTTNHNNLDLRQNNCHFNNNNYCQTNFP